MIPKSFITSDNREIKFIEGWYDVKNEWPFGIKTLKEFSRYIYHGTPKHPSGYYFLVNKIAVFNYIYEVMSETFNIRKYNRCLDIGTGLGIQPRLIKAMGLCGESWGLDLIDRSEELNTELTSAIVERMKCDMLTKSTSLLKTIDNVNYRLSSKYPIHIPYTLNPKCDYSLDKYIVSDFMSYNFGDNKFDMITAIFVIEFFDANTMFKKIYELLNPGGVFFFIVDYWYELFGSSMHLPMDAPWLHARLTRKDLIRYYYEVRPEIAPYAEKCIYFVNTHLTPNDYAIKARNAGLIPVSYRRNGNDDVLKLIKDNPKQIYESINDAQIVNPSVSVPDFFTYYLTMIFRKEK